MLEDLSGPVGEQLNGTRLEAHIWVTQMKPAEGVALRDLAIPLRWGVDVTQTTDDSESAAVTASRAKFRLVNGRESFQWTSRQFVHLRDGNRREPFLEAVLFEAGGMFYMIAMNMQGAVPTTSVLEEQYSTAWSAALRQLDFVAQQVVPPVVGERDLLLGVRIEAPPGFMRMADSAGQFPIGDEQDVKRVSLYVFNGLGPLVPFPGRHGVSPASIRVSELVAERALSLDRWASILRSGVPGQGGVSKGDSDVVRFFPLRRTTIASAPVLTWTGTGSRCGVYTKVAGAVFSRNGHSYFVSTAQLDAHGPPKGKPDMESTALDMVRRILQGAPRTR